MIQENDNTYWVYRRLLFKDRVDQQISKRIPTLELWIRIFLAPMICLAGGYFIHVYLFPALFALAISLANFQKELKEFNFLFFVPNLILSFAVFWMGILMWGLFGNFLKVVLEVNMEGGIWFTGVIVFVFTPLLLFRLYAYLFNYSLRSVGNLLKIALCLVLINTAFFTADALRSDFISDDQTKFPYFVWLIACCFTMQLLIYSRHIRPDSSSK